MMMVIRRDPEKPIDLSSIPVGKNVALMWRFEDLAAAAVGRAIRILTDRWERKHTHTHPISLAAPGLPPRALNVCHGCDGLHPRDKRREKWRRPCLAKQ